MSKALITREAAQVALDGYREKNFNVLTPVTEMEVPPGTAVSLRVVNVVYGTDTYEFGHGATRSICLSGVALSKLAAAAGLSWLAVNRTDDRRHPHYCEYEAVAQVVDFDGTTRVVTGTKVIDLRSNAGEGIPGKDLEGMSGRQLDQTRKFMTEICASKAQNRAIRKILAIRSSYKEDELTRPFVVPKLMYDFTDPDAKRAALAGMAGANDALFGKTIDAEVVKPKVITAHKDEEKPEKPENAEALDYIKGAFAAGREGGISTEELAKIAKEIGGAAKRQDITMEGAKKVGDAIQIRVMELVEGKTVSPDGVTTYGDGIPY